MFKRYFSIAATAAIVPAAIVASALTANAATPGCTAVPGIACASWNAEVPNLPDLDVQGGAAVSGNVLIVFTRTNHDKAEDFRVENVDTTQHSTFDVSGSFNGGVVWHTASANVAVPGAVRIQYSPNGVASGLCVSSVNPNGFASAQLRHCADAGLFNPYQTFQRTDTGNPGDGQFVTFREVINGHLLTDPRNDGYIGSVGNRIQVKFAGGTGTIHTGQLWGRNGA